MTITELRTEFRIRTGDLNILDVDIDKYVNRGIKFLDMLTEYTHAPAKYHAILAANTHHISFDAACRAIREVWLIEANTGRVQVNKIQPNDMKLLYPTAPNDTGGIPSFYSIDIMRAFPDTFDPAAIGNAAYVKYLDTQISNWLYRGIEFNCPTDKEYMVEVIGLFNHPALTDIVPAITTNWWTEQQPEATMLAAMYHMELTYRNSEGASDYLTGINSIITGIDRDKADEESAESTQM